MAASLLKALAGWAGVRLDRPAQAVVALPIVVAVTFLGYWLVERGSGRWVILFAWVFYYVGNSVLLLDPVRRRLIGRLGEARASLAYEIAVGSMFAVQGLALSAACVVAHDAGTLGLSPLVGRPLAALLFAVGFTVKLWATVVAGLDVYYYRDMFVGRPTSRFVVAGPYRVLANPMYGVGNLHSYAPALWVQSPSGLACAALFQASIYVFYLFFERRFVQRTYAQTRPVQITVAGSADSPPS